MKNNSNHPLFPWLLPAAPILWVGAGMASCYEEGMNLFALMGRFTVWMARPFAL